jgi:hypothetical protein
MMAIMSRKCFKISNYIQLGPSWEAAICATTQEFPKISWNPKVHYGVHKSPLLVPVLSQINPAHTTPSYFSKVHLNIILSPISPSSYWPLCFWLSHQNPMYIPLLPNSSWYKAMYETYTRILMTEPIINCSYTIWHWSTAFLGFNL